MTANTGLNPCSHFCVLILVHAQAHISGTIVSTCVQEERGELMRETIVMKQRCTSVEVRNSMLYCYYGNHSIVL